MNRNLFIALFAILSFNGYSQIKYDSGYFVANDGRKNVCLIKNIDWQYNPTEFYYKQTENGDIQKATVADVREFGIFNFSRYERYEVNIDTSAQEAADMDANHQPEYKKATVFLKILVLGKATLYEYRHQNLSGYFFKTNGDSLRPLIHKTYYSSDDENKIQENNLFRNQLFAALQAPGLDEGRFAQLSYTDRSLIGVFEAYNKIQHSGDESFAVKKTRSRFNLNLRVGADFSGLNLEVNYTTLTKTPFPNKVSPTLGLEAEFILPFNKNKWAFLLQPSYHYYKSDLSGAAGSGSANYKLLETAIGWREYFFLDKDSKLFATVLGLFDTPIGSEAVVYGGDSLNDRFRLNAALSAGYKYKNKCSIELQYTLTRSILDTYVYWRGQFHSLSLIFAYTLN